MKRMLLMPTPKNEREFMMFMRQLLKNYDEQKRSRKVLVDEYQKHLKSFSAGDSVKILSPGKFENRVCLVDKVSRMSLHVTFPEGKFRLKGFKFEKVNHVPD